MTSQLPSVGIIELGSQYTLLIERTLRELGVRSAILAPNQAIHWCKNNSVKAVILSGGAASVYDPTAPQPPVEILSLTQADGHPVAILGICYGMQWLAHRFGGQVKPLFDKREYGEAEVNVFTEKDDCIFTEMPMRQKVWMSHGDSITHTPGGFDTLGYTDAGAIAAMRSGQVWGVQFHPEVTHTEYGKQMLENFLRLARCSKDWVPASIISSIREEMSVRLEGQRVIFGFSGGVDSTTVSAILAPVLGDSLLAVAIDGGQLREGEVDEIKHHATCAGVKLEVIDAKREFAEVMADVVDAEEKRRRFKMVYASIFVRVAQEVGATVVLQGTLAPDRIESGATGGALIKSHHNVGLDMGDLVQMHPVDHLFKYEVRVLARELGLPKSVWNRQPFPGPGLFLRVVGVPATPDKLEVARWADARGKEVLIRHGVFENLSQYLAPYIGINTVGVKGDARVYGGAVVVRAVETVDFMTARGVHFSDEVEEELSAVLTRHPDIVRVWFDPTKKPPATTEME